MDEFEKLPFTCIDVKGSNSIFELQKKLDDFFPSTIVRLKIDGSYSGFFYTGNGLWRFMKTNKTPKKMFSVKTSLNENILEYLDDDTLSTLVYLDFDIEKMMLAYDVILFDKSISGYFFTNGDYAIVHQAKIENSELLLDFLLKDLNSEIIFDLTNKNNDGIMVLKFQNRL